MAEIINPNESLESVSPLWAYANKLREILKDTPDVTVGLDEPNVTVIVEVTDEKRWRALKTVLPKAVAFGSETLIINVKLEHFGGESYLPDSVYEAFKDNPHFQYIYEWADPDALTAPCCWVVVDRDALVYPESNLHQIYGDTVILRADALHDVLTKNTDYMFYCADSNTEEHPREIPDKAREFNPKEEN